MIQGPEDHLYRDPLQGLAQNLRDPLTEAEQHGIGEQGGIELELDTLGRGFPVGGQIQHPLGPQEGLFNSPSPPIHRFQHRGNDVSCRY